MLLIYEQAANLFCEIGETCMEKNITKFHAKGFFQKCVFCHLAMGDTVGASEAAETGALKKCSKFLRCQCFGFHYN